jgi:hypothetical protein
MKTYGGGGGGGCVKGGSGGGGGKGMDGSLVKVGGGGTLCSRLSVLSDVILKCTELCTSYTRASPQLL